MRSWRLVPVVLVLGVAASAQSTSPIVPDSRMTPGDVLTSDPKVICVPGYTKTVRNVPTSLKNQVYKAYGITSRKPGEYEIDHLISLELGGSNSVRNLWPESFVTKPLNAQVKDDLENKLHDLACSGKISFPEAQQAIATNWVAAYAKYVGPLPGGAKVGDYPVTAATGKATPPVQPAATPAPQASPGASRPPTAPPPVAGKPVPANPDGSCPASAPIKGSRSGIYHLQDDPNYKATKAMACFATEAAARAAGYRAPSR